jgi:hypothetical protein
VFKWFAGTKPGQWRSLHRIARLLYPFGGREMKSILLVAVAGVLASGLAAGTADAATFECPYSREAGAPALSRDISKIVPDALSRQQRNDLEVAIGDLRRSGLSPDQTVNHLVASYCPAVAAQTGLSEDQKTERVMQFAQEVMRLVLPPSNEEAIIYNISLPASIAQAAQERASQSGLSVEQWIARTVESALR